MTDRPILRFPEPTQSNRSTGARPNIPQPRGPGRARQKRRFQPTFDRLAEAFSGDNPAAELRSDPTGISPDRALVFVTAGSISNFIRAAERVGLEVLDELALEEFDDVPDGFAPPGGKDKLPRALYTTVPSVATFAHMLRLWAAYTNHEKAPLGAAPWWSLFDLLLELRPWGPQDRLPPEIREDIALSLPGSDDAPVHLEFEIWPTANAEQRAGWKSELEAKIREYEGEVVDSSSIGVEGFIYEAVLASLSAGSVRALLQDAGAMGGLLAVEGLQFILPQMVAQSIPSGGESSDEHRELGPTFTEDLPFRAVLLDGTPAAEHQAIAGGVSIEDIHDLVPRSEVRNRVHGSAMASLILRGDLTSDGEAVPDTRLLSVPILIDSSENARSPNDRLLVDLLHVTLMRLFKGQEPLAPDSFVLNLSIGLATSRFGGRMNALARLLDWWAYTEGILFIISAGNIPDALPVRGYTYTQFEDAGNAERIAAARASLQQHAFDRQLLAPSEAVNSLTVGATSEDLSPIDSPAQAGAFHLDEDDEGWPQLSSAVGLGFARSIKPDVINTGGVLEWRATPAGRQVELRPTATSQRTGLVVANPDAARSPTRRSLGTSPATALTTRAVLQAARALTLDGGPFEGQELPRIDLSLLTRALTINSAIWPKSAFDLYDELHAKYGPGYHQRAKYDTARVFGHGTVAADRMLGSPHSGATLVGLATLRKDGASIFELPLPPSMAGQRLPRSMRVTLAWFSPTTAQRAQYRLASIEAIAWDANADKEDRNWAIDVKGKGPDAGMVKRGTVWSRRFVQRVETVPEYADAATLAIRVQCRDAANGGLNPDFSIRCAIAVSLEVEAEVEFDVLDEIEQQIHVRAGVAT